LLPVSKNPPDYVFPPLLLLYLLLGSPLFDLVFLFFLCIIIVLFRQRQPRPATGVLQSPIFR
jgi:hypothetical protein